MVGRITYLKRTISLVCALSVVLVGANGCTDAPQTVAPPTQPEASTVPTVPPIPNDSVGTVTGTLVEAGSLTTTPSSVEEWTVVAVRWGDNDEFETAMVIGDEVELIMDSGAPLIVGAGQASTALTEKLGQEVTIVFAAKSDAPLWYRPVPPVTYPIAVEITFPE